METPTHSSAAIRSPETKLELFVYFYNAAEGNLAVQLLTGIGIPGDRVGVVPPEKLEGGQGMVLSVGCPTESLGKGRSRLPKARRPGPSPSQLKSQKRLKRHA